MNHLSRRTLTFFIVFVLFLIILFSYFFSSSRADRITSNEEYIASLKEASRGKRLAGSAGSEKVVLSDQEIAESQPDNIFEELVFQIKALFKVR